LPKGGEHFKSGSSSPTANATFSGTAKRTDCDTAIAENWGTRAPATGLPKDNFGVRWTVTRDFGSGGLFALSAAAQDGIRVYVDGVRKIDLWKNVTVTRPRTRGPTARPSPLWNIHAAPVQPSHTLANPDRQRLSCAVDDQDRRTA